MKLLARHDLVQLTPAEWQEVVPVLVGKGYQYIQPDKWHGSELWEGERCVSQYMTDQPGGACHYLEVKCLKDVGTPEALALYREWSGLQEDEE